MDGPTTQCQFLVQSANGDHVCMSSYIWKNERCASCIAFQNDIREMTLMDKFDDRYKDALNKSMLLTSALDELGTMASEILGYDVVADICNGEEIEFRRVADDGIPDSFDTIFYGDIQNAYS